MISSLFTRNSSVQEDVRGLRDHLRAVIPTSHRKCPPMEIATVVLKAEWMMMRNDWSKVGSAFLEQYSEDSVQDTNQVCKDRLCAPHDVHNNGLTTPSYAPKLDRAAIKLPVRPPGMAKTSDTAGHLGHIAEDHLVTDVRAFSGIHQKQIPPQAQHL
eukprot:352151-Pyramimonas_sp.AAC.1